MSFPGTEQLVEALRARIAKHGSAQAMAKDVGCSDALLSMIKAGKRQPNDRIAKHLGFRKVERQGGDIVWVTGPMTEEEIAEHLWSRRRRRWRILAEDGEVFGLTPKETAELAELEVEFGPSGLADEFRAKVEG
jgi:hypothetical protein